MPKPSTVPADRCERHEAVAALLDSFAVQHLDAELTGFVHTLWLLVCRREDPACLRGQPAIWAAAVTLVIARMNFLFDSKQPGYLTQDKITEFYGTKKTTTGNKASEIERDLKLRQYSEPGLCRASQLEAFTTVRLSNGLLISFTQAKQLGYLPPDAKVEDLR
jgi:Domain of unknown function (DUF6398)